MSALSGIPAYWLNFLLHTALLSTFVWMGCLLIRDPSRRAFAAAAGTFAILVLPWFSALRALPESRKPVPQLVESGGNAWSEWTIRIEDAREDPAPMTHVEQAGASAPPRIDRGLMLGMLWISGAVIGLGVAALRQWRLARWVPAQRDPTEMEWRMVQEMGLARRGLRISGDPTTPCVIGFFRPTVVIPEFLLQETTTTRLAWALRHETEHLRSGDSRVAVLLSCARAALWWNPFVHSLCGIWAEDRERVCDARATEGSARPRAYGSFLLDLAEQLPPPLKGAVTMIGTAAGRRMRKRLRAILRGEQVKESSVAFRVTSCVAMVAAALTVSFTGIRKAAAVEPAGSEIPASSSAVAAPPPVAPSSAPVAEVKSAPEEPTTEKQGFIPPMVKIMSNFMVTKEPVAVAAAGRILTEPQFMELIQGYTGFLTPPAVAARPGKKATIFIVHTKPGTLGRDHEAEEVRKVPFVGLHLEMTPGVSGDLLSLSVDCLLNYEPGRLDEMTSVSSGLHPPKKNSDWSTVRSASAKVSQDLKSGETMAVAFKGVEEGRYLTGFFTVTALDATGRTFDASGSPLPGKMKVPPVWRDGSMNVHGAVIELPSSGKLPSFWFANGRDWEPGRWGALYPARWLETMLQEARDAGGAAASKDLGMAAISSGPPVTPWKHFPLTMEVKRSQQEDCQIKLRLPDAPDKEILMTCYLDDITGYLLPPTADGRQRWLLLALTDAEK